MAQYYLLASHNLVKALDRAGVVFPISRAALLERAGAFQLQIDFDRQVTVAQYLQRIELDYFENKCQFFGALLASNFAKPISK